MCFYMPSIVKTEYSDSAQTIRVVSDLCSNTTKAWRLTNNIRLASQSEDQEKLSM